MTQSVEKTIKNPQNNCNKQRNFGIKTRKIYVKNMQKLHEKHSEIARKYAKISQKFA